MEVVSPKKDCCRHLYKPLHGYSFYIDVGDDEDGEGDNVDVLVGKIMSLGGSVRKSLSRNVLYFITAGQQKHSAKIRRSNRFMKQNETRAKTKLQHKDKQKQYRDRSRAKEEPVISKIDRAKRLGLNIFKIDKVTKWLTEIERRRHSLSPKRMKYADGNESINKSIDQTLSSTGMDVDDPFETLTSLAKFKFTNRHNMEELRPPFIKVEDRTKAFEPQYLELNAFPTICFDTKMPRSPFKKINLNTTLSNNSGEGNNGVSSSHTSGRDPDKSDKSISSTSNYSKSGYCDFCECFFRCRDRHIQTKKHQYNIPYENFNKLDDLISNGGSFDDFLKAMLKKKVSEEVLSNLERRKELTDFLKTLEGKRRAREFFTDLNGFDKYSPRKSEHTRLSEGSKKRVIR